MVARLLCRTHSANEVERSLRELLDETELCAVSTVTPRGLAHVHTAYFCVGEGLDLYFLSDPRSVHARNLKTNPSAAIAVYRSTQQWGGADRGVELFGRCREVPSKRATEAERCYAKRFPRYARWLKTVRAEVAARNERLRSYRFFRFVPRRLKLLDEPRFGDAVFVEASFAGRAAPHPP